LAFTDFAAYDAWSESPYSVPESLRTVAKISMVERHAVMQIPSEFRLRQRSLLNGFKYDFVGQAEELLGSFEFAFFSQALNGRLKFYAPDEASKGAIQMHWMGKDFLVHHKYTRRGFTNDLRYVLWGPGDELLAEPDVLVATKKQRLPRILLTAPVVGEPGPFVGWPKRRCDLTNGQTVLGSIAEPGALTLKRELIVRLPGLRPEVAAFMAVVTLCVRY